MVDKIPSQQHVTMTPRNTGMKKPNQDVDVQREKIANYQELQQSKQRDEWKVWNSEEKLHEIVSALNHFLQPVYTSLKFVLHEKLDEYYVQVIDDSTKEVVREIPPEKLLDMYAAMAEYLGLIVDEKI